MRRAAAGLALLLAAAGCAGGDDGPAARAGAPVPAAAVAWMDGFCAVVADLRTGLWGSAGEGAGSLRERLAAQLDTAAGTVDATVEELAVLPDAAVDGGTEASAGLSARLDELRASLSTGAAELASLPPGAGEAELGAVVGEVWPGVAARAAEPLDGIPVTESMRAAATGVACRGLPGLG